MDTSEVFISNQKTEPQPDYTADELQRVTSFFDLLIKIDQRLAKKGGDLNDSQ